MPSLWRILHWFTSTFILDMRTGPQCSYDGWQAYERGEWDSAIEHYTEAIAFEPSNSHNYYNRGAAWYAKAEYDRAFADFTNAVRLDPKSLFAYDGRGLVFLVKFDYDRAIDEFSTAIQLDPANAHTFCNRGSAWLGKADSERLVNGTYQLDSSIPHAPAGSDARFAFDHALADFGEALQIDPRHPGAFVGQAAVWHTLGEYDKAIDAYNMAIRLDPQNYIAYSVRGAAWRNLAQYGNAIADFETALRLAPADIWSLNSLAWLLGSALDDKVRDGSRAVELARHVLAQDPDNPAWIDTVAVAYAEAGDFTLAVAWEKQALQDAPAPFEADMRMRLELFHQGRPYRQRQRLRDTTHILRLNAESNAQR